MLNFDVKRKINTLRDILVGKVPDPKAQVEQITIAMIYKFMDDMDIEAMEFGGERVFFKDEFEKYAWSNLMSSENSGQQRALVYAEGIDKMSMNPHIPQLFRDIFRGAYIPYRDPETLNMFLKEIGEFSYDNSEDLGNAFEYLLMIMGSQGDAGQFRTPRHIIDMMVEIVNPKKNDTILDPACGTAGFLISAYKHILKTNVDENGKSTLTSDDKKRLTDNFAGYDISPDMVRLARVNMYLHRFTKPQISEYDTLSSDEKWDDNYDIILANPPFMTPKGGIIPHNRYRVKAKRAEVLFVDYIAEHLNPTGRAAIIVPEGIVFQSANAYKELRKYLVDDGLLYAVISLPAGVFNPYSGVKTSILLIDKPLARMRDDILFVKMKNDGFDLGAQRREIKQNDIPDIINIVKAYQKGEDVSSNPLVTMASKEKISKQEYILVGERYKEEIIINSKWPLVKICDIAEVISGNGFPKELQGDFEGDIPFYKVSDMNLHGNESAMGISNNYITEKTLGEQNWMLVSENTVIFPKIGAAIATNKKRMLTKKSLFDNNVMGIVCNERIEKKYLYYMLKPIDLKQWASESNPPSIRKTTVEQFVVPLPPLSVQKEIVEEIESYQKIIDGAKQIVDNYKPIIKIDSDWEITTIKEICSLNPVKSEVKEVSSDTLVSFVPMSDVSDSDMLFMPQNVATLSEVYSGYTYFRDEDVLLAKVTPCFENGKSGIARNLCNGIGFGSSEFYVLRPDKTKILPEIIYYTINSDRFINNGKEHMTGTGGLRRLTKDYVLNAQIAVPSMETQKRIVDSINTEINIVEQNKRLIEIFEQKISDKISEVWGD
ncbi:MAG: N-6 DNA methylase [Clostridia bacterium]|nr:N-6 DNA methylase [Clostridia bacterium]